MNEFVFFLQAICVLCFAGFAFRLGSATLITWVTVQALIANIFVLKQITLFGFNVTASDTFAIGSLMGLNLLQEYHGVQEAKKATTSCFFFLLFFAVVSQLHLLYAPSAQDVSNESFILLLSPSPRLFLASMVTFFVVQRFDIVFFAFLQKKLPTFSFPVRAAFSLIVSQALDTTLFSVLGLYGIVISLADILVVSFAIKLLSIFLFTSGIRWAKG